VKHLRTAVVLTSALLLGSVSSADAQGAATIRGQVYSCATQRPVASVRVRLRGPDEASTTVLAVDRNGRFTRVGVTPGRYLISVIPAGPAITTRHPYTGPEEIAPLASRLGRVETDDVLDVRIGVAETPSHAWVAPVSLTPQPVCDAAIVPPAPSTSNRYIIH
jgi:Carboxypeptidase regulatory-like domain